MTASANTRIGLRYGTVTVTGHDPSWATVAAEQLDAIAHLLGPLAAGVEHVGSTAVPGLPAKPILDLAVRLAPDANPSAVIDALSGAGWLFRGDKGPAGGMLFAAEPESGLRTVHVHVIADGDPQWDRYLAVRDRLRTRPQVAAAYGELKARLAAQHPHDRAAYTGGKDAFLRELLADLPAATAPPLPLQRVRALLLTPSGRLLVIRRTKPGQPVHWVLPGGGIEPGDGSLEDAAHREIREEAGGEATLHRLVHIATVAGHSHGIFLGRIQTWDPAARTGPELGDPANGGYELEELPLDAQLLEDGRIWPVPTTGWLAQHVRARQDLFTLPDLRDAGEIRWRSRRAPQPWDGPLAMVTGSTAKYTIAADHLGVHGVAVEHVRLDLMEIQAVDVAQVARHKAEQAYAQLGRPVIVEDSAFGLDELAGYPGALVKHLIDAGGAQAMAHLAGLTVNRVCTSTAALVYADADGLVTFTRSRAGTVARQPHGSQDRLPLWTVYIPPGATLPLAAMPQPEYAAWQHQWRQRSVFAQFARWHSRHRHTPETGTSTSQTAHE